MLWLNSVIKSTRVCCRKIILCKVHIHRLCVAVLRPRPPRVPSPHADQLARPTRLLHPLDPDLYTDIPLSINRVITAFSYSHSPLLFAMSFLGGAECSTGANPLSQFTKHVQDDKSLQRDRLVGRGPGGMQEGMRSQQMGGPSDGVRWELWLTNANK